MDASRNLHICHSDHHICLSAVIEGSDDRSLDLSDDCSRLLGLSHSDATVHQVQPLHSRRPCRCIRYERRIHFAHNCCICPGQWGALQEAPASYEGYVCPTVSRMHEY